MLKLTTVIHLLVNFARWWYNNHCLNGKALPDCKGVNRCFKFLPRRARQGVSVFPAFFRRGVFYV